MAVGVDTEPATQCKTEGNDKLKAGDIQGAFDFYTRGLELTIDKEEFKSLRAQLLSNRAHVLLQLAETSGNPRETPEQAVASLARRDSLLEQAIEDSEGALLCDASNPKAYWRGAMAALRRGLCAKAASYCERGLTSLGRNPPLEALQVQAHRGLAGIDSSCGICLAPLFVCATGNPMTIALPCGHVLHKTCAEEMRRQGIIQEICPHCRADCSQESGGLPHRLAEAVTLCTRSRGEANWGLLSSKTKETAHHASKLLYEVLSLEPDNSIALTQLGHLHHHGYGVDKSPEAAVKFWSRAAEQDNPMAQFCLSKAFLDGKGVGRDLKKWMELLKRAATQGLAPAQSDLGLVYKEGRHVTPDYIWSVKLFESAAAQGWAPGLQHLSAMYLQGIGVEKDVNRGMELLAKAANQGDAPSSLSLAGAYASGVNGLAPDPTKTLKLLEQAAAQGNVEAMHAIGLKYMRAEDVPRDTRKAVEFWKRAAARGLPGAQVDLAFAYLKGDGVSRDRDCAAELLLEAAAQGESIPRYLYDLGIECTKDEGIEHADWGRAAELWKAAAAQGDADAMHGLGMLHSIGHGVPKDMKRAESLYSEATSKGHKGAAEALELMRAAGS